MKSLIILLLVAIIFFLVWNGRQIKISQPVVITPQVAMEDDGPVSPDVTQRILDKIRIGEIPIDTLSIKHMGDGNYNARFLFFDPKGYKGTQYDVSARVVGGSTEIISRTQVSDGADEWNPAYKGTEPADWTALAV